MILTSKPTIEIERSISGEFQAQKEYCIFRDGVPVQTHAIQGRPETSIDEHIFQTRRISGVRMNTGRLMRQFACGVGVPTRLEVAVPFRAKHPYLRLPAPQANSDQGWDESNQLKKRVLLSTSFLAKKSLCSSRQVGFAVRPQ